ncbi:MAG: hypothetical protein V4489_09425 [Chlamydiota bacterium]
MKLSCFALALLTTCSSLGLHATTTNNTLSSVISGVSLLEAAELAQELLVPFKDGFQLEDLVTISSILETHFNKNVTLSTLDKRNALQSVLTKIIDKQTFSSAYKSFLEDFIPALTFVVFPDSADDSLTPPTDPSPSEQKIITTTESFMKTLNGKLEWKDIPSSILFVCQFSTSYKELSSQEKAYLAKRVLGEIIDKTDTPFLPDAIFDEVFKRIGYPLIDYLVSKP